jgi:PKD repeat protein
MRHLFLLVVWVTLCLSSLQTRANITAVTVNPTAAVCGDTVRVMISGIYLCTQDLRDSITTKVTGSTIKINTYYHNPQHPICLGALVYYTDTVELIGIGGGNYTVETIYNHANGPNDSSGTSFTMTNCCPAAADLVASDTAFCEGGTVTFTDTSTFGTAWWWKENDVTFSTSALTTTRTFGTGGYYTIKLVTGDGSCMDSSEVVIGVKTTPNATFNFVPNLKDYQFYDQSKAWKAEYLWDFGDTNSDTAQHPAHTYADTGLHTVCLTVTNTCGTDSTCQVINVECTYPIADFVYSADSLTVDFTDSSTGANTYYWTFGDGNFTAVKDPSYTYASAGTYTVCLHSTNDCGTDTLCVDITIGNVGIGDLDLYGLTLFPNPATDQLTIAGLPSGDFSARFYDVLGRVSEVPVQAGKIDLELIRGTYIVELREKGTPVYRGRVVVR